MKSTARRWLSRRMERISGSRSARTGSFIAIVGVACAVTVMLLTLGIALGFKQEIRSKLSGFEPQIELTPAYSYLTGRTDSTITLDAGLRHVIDSVLPHAKASLSFRQPAILKPADDFAAIVIYGYDRAHSSNFEKTNIIDGFVPDFSNDAGADNSIVLSSATASRLRLSVGAKITACFFVNNAIKARPLTVAGIYESGFGEYDQIVAYGSLRLLQKLNKVGGDTGNIIEINGLDEGHIAIGAEELQQALVSDAQRRGLPEVPVVDNITHTGALYLNWLELLDTNVVVIFILMCCVSCFTLVSSLFIIILDKIQAIGILRSIGATRSNVNAVFVRICMRLVWRGIFIGNLIGLGFGWVQEQWKFVGLDPSMYYLDRVPYSFDWIGIALVDIGVAVLAWCVLVFPAQVAGRISPAKTLRYE